MGLHCLFICAVMELLFSEELGLVLEVCQTHLEAVSQRYRDGGLQCHHIGRTCGFGPDAKVTHLIFSADRAQTVC